MVVVYVGIPHAFVRNRGLVVYSKYRYEIIILVSLVYAILPGINTILAAQLAKIFSKDLGTKLLGLTEKPIPVKWEVVEEEKETTYNNRFTKEN
jgi:hypothetical protein